MLEYNRIYISEGIDIKKIHTSKKECKIGFKCEPYLCNGFHGLMQKPISFNNVANVKESGYRIYFLVYE